MATFTVTAAAGFPVRTRVTTATDDGPSKALSVGATNFTRASSSLIVSVAALSVPSVGLPAKPAGAGALMVRFSVRGGLTTALSMMGTVASSDVWPAANVTDVFTAV